jgi:hypothetical protein
VVSQPILRNSRNRGAALNSRFHPVLCVHLADAVAPLPLVASLHPTPQPRRTWPNPTFPSLLTTVLECVSLLPPLPSEHYTHSFSPTVRQVRICRFQCVEAFELSFVRIPRNKGVTHPLSLLDFPAHTFPSIIGSDLPLPYLISVRSFLLFPSPSHRPSFSFSTQSQYIRTAMPFRQSVPLGGRLSENFRFRLAGRTSGNEEAISAVLPLAHLAVGRVGS